jgi:hypothetical protein
MIITFAGLIRNYKQEYKLENKTKGKKAIMEEEKRPN